MCLTVSIPGTVSGVVLPCGCGYHLGCSVGYGIVLAYYRGSSPVEMTTISPAFENVDAQLVLVCRFVAFSVNASSCAIDGNGATSPTFRGKVCAASFGKGFQRLDRPRKRPNPGNCKSFLWHRLRTPRCCLSLRESAICPRHGLLMTWGAFSSQWDIENRLRYSSCLALGQRTSESIHIWWHDNCRQDSLVDHF